MTRPGQPRPTSDHVFVLSEVAREDDEMPYHPGRRLDRALAAAHLAGINPTAITIQLDPNGAATGISIDTAPGTTAHVASVLCDLLGAEPDVHTSEQPQWRAEVAGSTSDLDVPLTVTADRPAEHADVSEGDGADVIDLSHFRTRQQQTTRDLDPVDAADEVPELSLVPQPPAASGDDDTWDA